MFWNYLFDTNTMVLSKDDLEKILTRLETRQWLILIGFEVDDWVWWSAGCSSPIIVAGGLFFVDGCRNIAGG